MRNNPKEMNLEPIGEPVSEFHERDASSSLAWKSIYKSSEMWRICAITGTFGFAYIFIKTVEDIYEAMVNTVPNVKFGLAFCEASVRRLIRLAGTDDELTKLAKQNALAIGAGHSFIIMMKECFPINVLNAIKAVPEVCSVYCATANPTTVIVAEMGECRGIIGVMDGKVPVGVEDEEYERERREIVRRFGYKM